MFFFKRNALLIIAVAVAPAIFAQSAFNRYALILGDPPVTQRFAARDAAESTAGASYRQQLEARQQSLREVLASRHITVTGSVTMLTNAIFVAAPKERVDELKSLPRVKGVVALRRHHLDLNRATILLNGPAAWSALGGTQNAGAGIKIAIIDTGIDQTHPAFQDSSLAMPAGYPICNVSNCASYTNSKVIVARSYVQQLAAGSDPNNPAADSRPDDYSPRDRSGHGTATASCAAAVSNTGPAGLTFTGMAPKAYLGNYKIFGSPTVNDGATDDGRYGESSVRLGSARGRYPFRSVRVRIGQEGPEAGTRRGQRHRLQGPAYTVGKIPGVVKGRGDLAGARRSKRRQDQFRMPGGQLRNLRYRHQTRQRELSCKTGKRTGAGFGFALHRASSRRHRTRCLVRADRLPRAGRLNARLMNGRWK